MASTPTTDSALTTRQKVAATAAIIAIVASGIWIYIREFRTPELNATLHRSIGTVLADETFRQVGRQGKVVLVTMDTGRAPELKVQMAAFQKQLKVLGGVTITDKVVLDPGDNPKFRPGSGLSTKRLLKIARKHKGVDAIVSFVGAPDIPADELKQLKTVPRLIAEAKSPERLANLQQEKVLLAAVVPRYEFPAPGPRAPQTSRQWFDHYFQVIRQDTVLPNSEATP